MKNVDWKKYPIELYAMRANTILQEHGTRVKLYFLLQLVY